MLEDLDVFFNTDEFALPAQWIHEGNTTDIAVIFDNKHSIVGGEMPVAVEDITVSCKSADVSGTKTGDALVFDGVKYTIIDAQPDGTGITRLVLEK